MKNSIKKKSHGEADQALSMAKENQIDKFLSGVKKAVASAIRGTCEEKQ